MKEKIAFTEELAKEIIERENLPAQYLAKWKLRGNIPSQYFEKKAELVPENDSLYPKLVAILGYKEIAPTKFRTFADRPQKAADVVQGRFRMTTDEKVLFMTEITEIRNLLFQCHKTPNLKNFRELFNDKRVHHTHLIEQNIRQQITKGTFDKNFLSKTELLTLQNMIINFHNRLYIK